MRKTFLFLTCVALFFLSSCKKEQTDDTITNTPRTSVPTELQGSWMFGDFSMTEYWSENPSDYLGNALEFVLAFKFEANGTYKQYFTAKSITGGVVVYQQAVSQGTVEINTQTKTIKTYPSKSHYKRTSAGQVVEERDLRQNEMNTVTYAYQTGVEPNGTKAVYLTLAGTDDTLTFLQKQ